MLGNSSFGKRPSTDLDNERSVCGKASPSTTPSRASHDNYKDNEGRSVHQLWPLEDHVRSTNFDVVFFHGLHWPSEKEAWKSTWTQLDDPQDCWPQNWLPQDLEENVRVLSISYDACPTQSEEKGSIDDVSEIGKNILQTLVLSDQWSLGGQHGFVLIGHCFGGLVIKSLVEEARKRARLGNVRNALDRKAKESSEMFLKNLKGVVFYAVPHSGSEKLISYFSRCNQITIPGKRAAFMQIDQPHQFKMEKSSTTFDAIAAELSLSVYAFVEGKPMKDAGFRLVEKSAAMRLAGENYYILEDCDHSTVCKPLHKKHQSYYLLLNFIRICRQEELIKSITYLGFEYNWKENFQFYVEPSNLPNILLQKLKEEGSKNILVYGGFGYGKTTLVKYVLYKNAEELGITFHGGIFHMRYGHKDNEVLSCQKELIRAIQLNPQELQGLECWQIGSVRAMLEKLLNGCCGPILLFIDDVWSEQMIDNSPEFVATKGSKLVVTSRFNLKPNQSNWIRIEMNERTNENAAAQLLASKAANNPDETKFPLGCEHIAKKLLSKCNGCLLAITIIGTILWENEAQTPEKWKDVYDKFKYYANEAPTVEDYKGESKTIFAAIELSLTYGLEESDWVGMENILQTLSLLEKIEIWGCPAIVVHLVWSYLQPERGIIHFKMLLDHLIARNLVDNSPGAWIAKEIFLPNSWEFEELKLPKLVQEYVSVKLHAIDICNILEKGSQELFTERKKILLATFLQICRTRHTNLEFALSLGQFHYPKWYIHQLFTLLGTEAENVILLASQPHKMTQGDINILLRLLNYDKVRTWAAVCILAKLAKHFYEDDIFRHISIQDFIQNWKHQWRGITQGFIQNWNQNRKKKLGDGEIYREYLCDIALKLVKYRTFAEQFAIDEDFMEIVTNIIIQNHDSLLSSRSMWLLFKLSQHKNVRNIFYQKYTKITMKNILKQISSKLIHDIKLYVHCFKISMFAISNIPLQYADMLAIQIIDEGGDDFVLGVFDYFFTNGPTFHANSPFQRNITKLLFLILERLAKRKEGQAIIIKHVHLLLRFSKCVHGFHMHHGVSQLVQHKAIAQTFITQEGVELLVGALERGKVAIVPLVLQCLFFQNEEFAYKVITQGGWRMMTKGLQLMLPYGMFEFSLMHIAREMASKGEIQELVMEVINTNNSEYCLKLLEHLVTYHMDIMREELIAKGVIRCLLACLSSLNHSKNYEIITSGLLHKVAHDIKGAEEMMAHNGIQVFVQLLVVGLNDNNAHYEYIQSIVDIIKLLINDLEDLTKLLKSSIDDIDVLKIHKTWLHRYHSSCLSFFPETLDVNINIAKEWLNSLESPFNAFNIAKDGYEDDYKKKKVVPSVLIQLSNHIDIASLIMANEGILERFLIQLSKGNLEHSVFKLLKVVLQHERVATEVIRQRPSFIKELLQLLPMEQAPIFKDEKMYSVASLLFILAKHGGVFIKSIVNGGGIKILLNKVLLQNQDGRRNVIEVLGIMAKDENYALRIEKAGGSKMILRVISCYLQYVHDTHLEKMTPDNQLIRDYEDDRLVMCCLKTFSLLLNHEEIAKQISTRRGDSKEYGIMALIDVMHTASQLWSFIMLILRETVVTKKLMQIKGHMLTILSNVASTLILMAKLHPHINILRKVNENVLKGIFQLQGIDEHQALKKTLQDLLDIKEFHVKTWICQQLRSKTIDMQSYEGKLGECEVHFGVKDTSTEGQSSGTTKEDDG